VAALTVQAVRDHARELGFLACGVTSLDPSQRAAELDAWLGAGYAGEMRYLHRQARKRKHPAEIAPGAKVAVVVLENYYPSAAPQPRRSEERVAGPSGLPADDWLPDSVSSRPSVRIAKYARGTDYHRALRARLERLADWLREQGATVARAYVDAGPVPERELAQRAGLGWIGKNTMLIRPGAGSFVFIGCVLTDLALAPDPPFTLDRCGSCTRCLEACPTQAFVAPRVLDATRCLSYLTIEQRGPIPAEAAGRMAGWAFGCDICNEVCPWNERFAVPTTHPEYQARPLPDLADPDYFDRLDEEEFGRRFGDTPLERPGLAGMRRNWRAAWASLGP
jgi:epoxyqueuosine reductase